MWRYLKIWRSLLTWQMPASVLYVFALSVPGPLHPFSPTPTLPNTHTLRRMFTTGLCSSLEGKQSRLLRVVTFLRWKVGVLHTIITFSLWPLCFAWLWQVPCKAHSWTLSAWMSRLSYTTSSPSREVSNQVVSPWKFSVIAPSASPRHLTYFSLIFWSVRTCLWLRALLLKCSFLVSPLYQEIRGISGDPISLAY